MADRQQLRKSVRNKLSAAETLAAGQCNLPVEVSYLCMVAMECALKYSILSRNNFHRTEQIPSGHNLYSCFHGTEGHDLAKLRRMAGKQSEKEESDRCWKRMKAFQRPYSLRYGSEPVSVPDCMKELAFTREVIMRLEDEQ